MIATPCLSVYQTDDICKEGQTVRVFASVQDYVITVCGTQSNEPILYVYNMTSNRQFSLNLTWIPSEVFVAFDDSLILFAASYGYLYQPSTNTLTQFTLPVLGNIVKVGEMWVVYVGQILYTSQDISSYFWHNFSLPCSAFTIQDDSCLFANCGSELVIYNATTNSISILSINVSNYALIGYLNNSLYLTSTNASNTTILEYNLETAALNDLYSSIELFRVALVGDYLSVFQGYECFTYNMIHKNWTILQGLGYITTENFFCSVFNYSFWLFNGKTGEYLDTGLAYENNWEVVTAKFSDDFIFGYTYTRNVSCIFLNSSTLFRSGIDCQSNPVAQILSSGVVAQNIFGGIKAYKWCQSNNTCNDGIFCPFKEYCDNDDTCSIETQCPSSNACQQCNEDAQSCFTTNGTTCYEGSFCDGLYTCNGIGECIASGDPCINNSICNNYCDNFNRNCTVSPINSDCGDCKMCNGAGMCIESYLCKETTSASDKKDEIALIIISSLCGVFVVVIVVLLVYLKRRRNPYHLIPMEDTEKPVVIFEIEDIVIETQIGSGEFGNVYKGIMDVSISMDFNTN